MSVPSGRRRLVLLAVVLLAVSCQPVDELSTGQAADGGAEAEEWGSDDLGDLTIATGDMAREWDGDARLVRVSVRLDGDLEWEEASTAYVAPDADRLLVITASEEGTEDERPTLETLGFEALSPEAVEEIPGLPADVVPPDSAAERAADALDDCDFPDEAQQVLYANGAPGSWDGRRWTSEPQWTVAVTSEGGGVRLGLDGAVPEDPCFEVP